MLRLLLALFTDPAVARPRRRQPQRNGFTLVELMVVIVIIGLLATVVMINVMPSQDRAMATKARADIATLSQAMEMYRLENMRYPTDLQALASARPGGGGGYVRGLPNDPWDRPYQLAVPGPDSAPFDIYSLGADGSPGGEGENADIRGNAS
ncbi:type II secretion system major pseudopilin GspG [Sphingomonas sp. LHG3406-1]|uniref:type II secretion system major pseudopilin GspG n=1 Tax=Sphingomonas sp. LHG3406-1 TaxID=2804617 RepID=UPI002632EF41|nr:type II secretion system major pseudopilin GspG [Sphingomonas sp. LHG3406-1]